MRPAFLQLPCFVARLAYSIILFVVVSSSMIGQSKELSDQQKVRDLLTRAYAALAINNAEAIPLFEEAADLDPSNVLIHRQLGSSYIVAGRSEDALRQFTVADTLMPSDTTRLQIAYLLNTLGRNKEAKAMFGSLTGSSDPDIRDKGRKGEVVLTLAPCVASERWWAQLSFNPYYDSRFENGVFNGAFRAGVYPGSQRVVSLYGIVSATKDTRSTSGAVPVIFSDNYALVGGGVRLRPFRGLTADVQGGVAFDIMDRPGKSTTEADFRSIVSYGIGVFPELATPNAVQVPFKPFVDFYISAGYYSRYKNTIGYSQLRAGVRAIEWRNTAVDVYLRGDFAADSRRKYYNNIAEASVGLRLIPSYIWNVSILAEYHRGTYWDRGLSTGPYNRYYDSFRFLLILEYPFCLD